MIELIRKIADWADEPISSVTLCVLEEIGSDGASVYSVYPNITKFGSYQGYLGGNHRSSKEEAMLAFETRMNEVLKNEDCY